MRITLTVNTEQETQDPDLLSLEVFPEMNIDTLRNSIQAETGHEPVAQHLYYNGQLITDSSRTLTDLGVGDGDMLALHIRQASSGLPAPPPQPRQSVNPSHDPETIRLQILGNPDLRAELNRSRPSLGAALDNPVRFRQLWDEGFNQEQRLRAERHRQIQALNADPFDIEAQKKIEEIIRQERVMENLQNAMEHNPEVFGYVTMLYLPVEVNGHKIKALVDSGAQATIMSPSVAEACGIMRLVDTRFSGIAKGVGEAKILGRVHSAMIKLGSLFLPCSFTVMEGKNVDLLLGLDMLKRFQATIDLAKDALVIQGEVVPFLAEAEIPKDSDKALHNEPTLPGPAGTTIGQRSGVVTAPTAPVPGGVSPAAPGFRPPGAPSFVRPGGVPANPGAAGPSSANAAPAPPAPRRNFPQADVQQLMALGASEAQAISALQATEGNVEYAASLIFDA